MVDLKQYLVLDKDRLDDELIAQASLLHASSEKYEIACGERDCLKETLATVDARLDASYRQQLGSKITEGTIKASVQADPLHAAAFSDYVAAKQYAGELGALADAFKDRSYMLRELCQLYRSNYFETDSVRSNDYDNAVYTRQRQRLAEARASKEKD